MSCPTESQTNKKKSNVLCTDLGIHKTGKVLFFQMTHGLVEQLKLFR